MENRKKSIAVMQEALNRIFVSGGAKSKSSPAYQLSIKLDKEIVKYYRSVANH